MQAKRNNKMNAKKIQKGVRLILEGLGEDPQSDRLAQTPRRATEMFMEVLSGTHHNLDECLRALTEERHEEMVILKDIPIYSMCEHHLLPFSGTASIAYIPQEGKIMGLNTIARLVDILAKRQQIHEQAWRCRLLSKDAIWHHGVFRDAITTAIAAVRLRYSTIFYTAISFLGGVCSGGSVTKGAPNILIRIIVIRVVVRHIHVVVDIVVRDVRVIVCGDVRRGRNGDYARRDVRIQLAVADPERHCVVPAHVNLRV